MLHQVMLLVLCPHWYLTRAMWRPTGATGRHHAESKFKVLWPSTRDFIYD